MLLVGGGFVEEAHAPAVEAARLAVASLAALRREPEPGDVGSAAEFLLGEEPDRLPGGKRQQHPHLRSVRRGRVGFGGQVPGSEARIFLVVLSAHLETPTLLTDEQIARYDALRGYRSHAGGTAHGGHRSREHRGG